MSSAASAAGGEAMSASTIVAEAVTGSHVLKIEGYSRTKGLGNGKFLSSGTFSVGGHRWCIIYYPDGYGTDNIDWISIFLRLDHTNSPEVKAQFMVTLLDHVGKAVLLYSLNDGNIRTFKNRGTWGYKGFIRRKALEESDYLKNDCFRVRCDVTVTKEMRTEATAQFVVVPPSDLKQHLSRLLESPDAVDVTFEVAGETVTAHKLFFAARSSVFMAELFGHMKEKTMSRIPIHDMEPRVFKASLHFIYTDSLPDIDSDDAQAMAQHLLVAADRYGMERLKLICEDKLCNYIDTVTTVTTLALAEQHGCHGLKEACFKFLRSQSNMKAVMATDGFNHLMTGCPSLLQELLAKVVPLP
ncbi:hypothetical protein ACP4OV_001916 [Aristida adscensionis]